MKKYSLPLLCLAVCLLLSGCTMTLMGENKATIPYETFGTKPQPEDPSKMIQYKNAMDALAKLDYQRALELFTELGDFKDAAEYAARFSYIEDTLLRTEQYTDGVLTRTIYATYDLGGNLLSGAADTGMRISYRTDDNGQVSEEAWQYSDHILINTYNTYHHAGTLAKQEKRPILNITGNNTKLGYTVSYRYDETGKLVSDQGQETQYIQQDQKTQTKELLFSGTYTYDEAGNLIRYDREYTWGGQGSSWEIYAYDDQDRLIRQENGKEGDVFFSDALKTEDRYWQETSIWEYRYNDTGNVILVTQESTSGSMFGGEQERSFIRTEYTYDGDRLIGETLTFGDTSDTIIQTCYVYGDYLGYIIEEGS